MDLKKMISISGDINSWMNFNRDLFFLMIPSPWPGIGIHFHHSGCPVAKMDIRK